MWAWLLQRLSAVLLIVVLFIHIWITRFNLVVDLTILALGLFHGLNGVRVILLDFGLGARWQKGFFWALLAVGIVAFLIGGSYVAELVAGQPLVPLIG
jgi:succinate dehydrogenase hydrophobic anchor subunit